MVVIPDCINNFSIYLFKKKKKEGKRKNANIIKQQKNNEQTDLAMSSIHIIFRDWRRGINYFGDCWGFVWFGLFLGLLFVWLFVGVFLLLLGVGGKGGEEWCGG